MLVIKGGTVYKSDGKAPVIADVLVDNGKIAKVGQNINVPDGCDVLDAQGMFVTAGLVDAHSHIGGFGAGSEQDLNEMTCNATPQVEAIYAIDPASPDFERDIKAGITTSAILPGSGNVIGGMVSVFKTYGKNIFDMCIKRDYALKMAMGGNPKGVYGPRKQCPMTRMGIAQVIIDTFEKALEYKNKKEAASGDATKMPPYDKGLENVVRVLDREIPMKVHCEQFDMLTVIRIAQKYNVEFTLDHAWGASDFYDEICTAKNLRGVIFGPIGVMMLPGEIGKVDIDSLKEMDERGVCCAIMTDGPIENPDTIVLQAGETVRFGVDPLKAIDFITINAAKILGVEDRVGSLEEGKDADVLLWSAQPALDVSARVITAVVDGKIAYSEN